MGKEIKVGRAKSNINKRIAFSLSDYENLLLWRRRLDWKQMDAAAHFGVSVFIYKRIELGTAKFPEWKIPKIPKITDYEKCLLWRRRANRTQTQIAVSIGCSKYWIYLQELGKVPCVQLYEYWDTKIKN